MIIGSISENKDIEKRISITPDLAKKYISYGFEILIEKDFASHLNISNEEFINEGCKLEKKEVINKYNKKKNIYFFIRAAAKNYQSSVHGYTFFASKLSWI